MARYTRKEAAEQLGIHPNTLYRLEKQEKLPAPRRLRHNRELIYDDEIIAAGRKFLTEEIDPKQPPATAP